MAIIINRKTAAVALLWVAALAAQAAVRADDVETGLEASIRADVLDDLQHNVERLYRQRDYVVVDGHGNLLADVISRLAGVLTGVGDNHALDRVAAETPAQGL